MKAGWIVALVVIVLVGLIVVHRARHRYDGAAAWCRRAYWGASSAEDSGRIDRQSPFGQTISCVQLREAGRTNEPEPVVAGAPGLRKEGDDARGVVRQLMRAVAARDSAQIRSLVWSDAVAARYLRSSSDSATWERFAAAQWSLVEISSKGDTLFPWYAAHAAQLGCSRADEAEFRIGLVLVRHSPTWRVGLYYPEPGTC
jgi:hypothetical protein